MLIDGNGTEFLPISHSVAVDFALTSCRFQSLFLRIKMRVESGNFKSFLTSPLYFDATVFTVISSPLLLFGSDPVRIRSQVWIHKCPSVRFSIAFLARIGTQRTHQLMTRMLSARISSLRAY